MTCAKSVDDVLGLDVCSPVCLARVLPGQLMPAGVALGHPVLEASCSCADGAAK